MIKVTNLTKRYGTKRAVDDISFSIEEGSVTGFLGLNGAGKSTTMNIITGYLSASGGSVLIGGHDILEEPDEAKSMIGYLPEIPPLYPDLTVMEYLKFVYRLKKCRLDRKKHLQEVCTLVRIEEVQDRLIGHLSKGYRQRVGIAQALIGDPKVLILDEPTVGLDPQQIIEIRNLIRELGKTHTVILSSHILSEIQAVCERVLILHNGKLVADGRTDSIARDLFPDHRIRVLIEGPDKRRIQEVLEKIPGVTDVQFLGEPEPGVYEFETENSRDSDIRRDLFRELAREGWSLLEMHTMALTLEEVFLRLTNTGAEGDALQEETDRNRSGEENL